MLRYNSLSSSFITTNNITNLPDRDKCGLFRDLLFQLGITNRFFRELNMEDEKAITIIEEQLQKAWDGTLNEEKGDENKN